MADKKVKENLQEDLESRLQEDVGEQAEEVETEEVSPEQKEIEELKVQVADYKDKWMRNVAEFDNYKKRNASLWHDAFVEGEKEVVLKILSIGDNLETAVAMITDENSRRGVELLLKQFKDTLKTFDAEEYDPTGEEFDPETAEAVMQVPAEEGEKENVVKTVFRKGYKLNGKIIRYAQVCVTKID
ncbi:MAG: nucleotide exchange factor GrpE [Clostridia bacterium]|nr:nucleotide exchange factor GrpE [Clostridia bacterium]